jgi:hypothetical protein
LRAADIDDLPKLATTGRSGRIVALHFIFRIGATSTKTMRRRGHQLRCSLDALQQSLRMIAMQHAVP